ncbi:MAG: Smr/MutS family protein [Rhizobiaceae bacterium]
MTSKPPKDLTKHSHSKPLTREDWQLWKRVADTITPRPNHNSSILRDEMARLMDAAASPSPSPSQQGINSQSKTSVFNFSPDAGISDTRPQPVSNQSHPIEERIARNLGRGKQAIDARIDLHGMTQDRARFALLDFLQMSQRANYRMVLVITGKGDQGRGVLKSNVPRWLALPAFAQLVNGHRESHATHGGEGALYVRIRKPKGRS